MSRYITDDLHDDETDRRGVLKKVSSRRDAH